MRVLVVVAFVVTAGVMVSKLFGTAGPITVFPVAVWILVFLCVQYKREHTETRNLRYYLCAVGILYLVPIGAAATFYVLISSYVSLSGDSISINELSTMQHTFENIAAFFANNIKLSEAAMFVVLVLIYVLTCLLLSRQPSDRKNRIASGVHRGAGLYTKYSGPVAAGLAALASFSLFGMHLGEPAKDLALRVKVSQQGYAEVAAKVEADLSDRVAESLYTKVRNEFPQFYQNAIAQLADMDGRVNKLRQDAAAAKSDYDIRVAAVDELLRDDNVKIHRVGTLGSELRVKGTIPERQPSDLTPEQIKQAKVALRSRESSGVDLISDGQRKVVLQVEKLLSERILSVTRPLTEAVPILDPLVQAFAEAIDTTLQNRLAKSYDRIIAGDPRTLGTAIDREARAIVDATDVSGPVERASPRAETLSRAQQQINSSLTAASKLLDNRVNRHQAAETAAARNRAPGHRHVRTTPKLLPMPELFPTPELLGNRYFNYYLNYYNNYYNNYSKNLDLWRNYTLPDQYARTGTYELPSDARLARPQVTPRAPRVIPRIFIPW